MNKDIDLRDMMLEVTARVQELMMEFEKQLTLPKMKSQFAQLWVKLPDEAKEKFKAEKPDEYRALMEALK